ncbi:phage terminase small subunit P27 family [Fictibacillus sp. S7]|uniref:phage terminase small subunit P27 family n=1 Tax=Fictibacillus sp. S7 TaxID=2212476 RepID=UPI001012AB4D|nr:phage terminase small subunit P27 family [Fictibacillus sp. S7]RXY98559.1 phage terminase small subunit P27 family [Fictibacillus sp. S7]
MYYKVGRPRKPASLKQGRSENKAELKIRNEAERKLMGSTDKVKDPPENLDSLAKAYYKFLVREMEASGLLCDLDIMLLAITAKCLSQLYECNEILNRDGILIFDHKGNPKEHPTVRTQDKLRKAYKSCCSQLGLSTLSNAQLGELNAKAKEEAEDPLLMLLKENS